MFIRSDEGLTLETSAFDSFYGGQFTLSTQLIKPNYLIYERLLIHQADIVVLTTSEENGLCYIETAELDG